jgi:hypothetical protein|tara:strand:+ start:445 stop:684 length:240 start_codon:yes stop_codon:yes gene_type:complete
MTNATTQQLDNKLDALQLKFEDIQLEWSEFLRMTEMEKVQSEKNYQDFINEMNVIRARVERVEVMREEIKRKNWSSSAK